jgi:hypothetical protein
MYRLLAAAVDLVHAGSMLVWGLGLPLLFWHRFRRLSRAYVMFSAIFVLVSLGSHALLGECVLTTLARHLWLAGGGYRDGIPFTALLANAVAGIRPTQREVVLVWELAVLASSVGSLWCWWKTRTPRPAPAAELCLSRDARTR